MPEGVYCKYKALPMNAALLLSGNIRHIGGYGCHHAINLFLFNIEIKRLAGAESAGLYYGQVNRVRAAYHVDGSNMNIDAPPTLLLRRHGTDIWECPDNRIAMPS